MTGAVLLCALVGGATYVVLDRRGADMAAAGHEIDNLSAALAEQTNLAFNAADSVLLDLRERIRHADIASPEALAERMGTPEMHEMLRDEVAGHGQIDILTIAADDGKLINSSYQWPVADITLRQRDYFGAFRDDPGLRRFIGGPAESRTTGHDSIHLARPIETPDGRFLGVVTGSIKLDYFASLYQIVSAGDGRSVGLQRRDGTMLARYPENGRALVVLPADTPAVRGLEQGIAISRSLGRSPISGLIVLRVARALSDFPLILVVARSEASILADWRRQSAEIGVGVALAAATLIIAFILLGRQIAGRAASEQALAVTLDHMSQGITMIDGDHRIQVYNQRLLQMLDIPAEFMALKPRLEELLRFHWEQGEFGREGDGVNDALRKFVLSGGMQSNPHSYERLRPNGTVLQVNSVPLTNGGVVRTFTDVTAARKREAALQAALSGRDEAETALRRHRDDLEREVAKRTQDLAASEARHRDVAEVASDWFWEFDATHHLTFVSTRFFETSGIASSAILGRRVDDLSELGFDPEKLDELIAIVDAHVIFQNVVNRVVPPGSGPRFWRLSGQPFVDGKTGAFAGYRGTGTDVTDMMEREVALHAALERAEQAEQEAQQARCRLVDAIEAIPEGFVLHDAEDRMVLCNARYREFYELPAEVMMPGSLFVDGLRDRAPQADPTPVAPRVEAAVAAGLSRDRVAKGNSAEERLANGRVLQVYERPTSDGGTVGIQIDVTEARQREAAERHREKLAALGELAGGVAHEINNLLQPVLALPEMVLDRLPPEDVESREDLDCVIDSAGKMRDIVRNILLFARNDEPRLASLDLVAEVRAAVDFVADLMPASIEVRFGDLTSHQGCRVAANQTQLTQVLSNLLLNAAQATTGAGSVTISVDRIDPTAEAAAELAIEAGRAYLVVSIADTGSGMDAATLARIFEPFFTTKPVGQGTGLGLSVAYGILRRWQGAIAVNSVVGQGTTFTLYVPILSVA